MVSQGINVIKKSALMIGGFIVLALLLVVAGVLWLSGSSLFDRKVGAVIYFQDGVAGLYEGAPVTFRGVAVGQVENIGLQVDPKTQSALIPVTIRLSPDVVTFNGGPDAARPLLDVPALVQRGLRAKLVSQSLVTGQKLIDLNLVVDAPAVAVRPGPRPEIPVMADRFGVLVDQVADLPLREIVQDLRETMKIMRTTLDTANGALVQATSMLGDVGRELAGVGSEARKSLMVANAALVRVQDSANRSLQAVSRLADNANGTVTAVQPDLLRTLTVTREAAESARLATQRLAELTAAEAPFRSDLDSALADLAQATRGLRDWSELLQEQPNAIIFGRQRSSKGSP